MLVAVLTVSAVLLLLTMVIAWLVYTVATMRTQMASISEVNEVVDSINSMSKIIMDAHNRTTTRIHRTNDLASLANQTSVGLSTDIGTIKKTVDALTTSERKMSDDITLIDTSVKTIKSLGDSMSNTLNQHSTQFGYYLKTDDFNQSIKGYAKWDGDQNVNKMLTADGVNLRYMKNNSPENGGLTMTDDGLNIKMSPAAKTVIGSDGISFGSNSIRIDDKGDALICRDKTCTKLAEVPAIATE